jgi:uncharacterized membrane protein
MTATIDAGQLFELVWVSLVAGVVVATVFGLIVLGLTRADDLRRAGSEGVASAYLVLAVAAGLALAGGIVFGIHVIVAK